MARDVKSIIAISSSAQEKMVCLNKRKVRVERVLRLSKMYD